MTVPAHPTPQGTAPPWLALGWLLLLCAGGTLLLVAAPHRTLAQAGPLLALVLLPALALALVQRAGQAGGAALAGLAAAVVLLSDATLRGAPEAGLDLQSVAKFGLWVLGLLLVCWRRAELGRALRHPPTALLALFGLWCLLGSALSVTPVYSAGAALAWLGLWVLAVVLASALTPRQGAMVLAAALAAAMVLSLALLAVAPAWALTPMDNGRVLRLSGIFASPNNLGRAAALVLLLALLLLPGQRRAAAWPWLLAAALGAAGLWLSDNRGSMAALAAALAVVLLGRRPLAALALAAVALAAGLLLAAAPWALEALGLLVSRSGRLDELSTLTGRTEIWAASWRLIEQAPWLGHGYASSRELLPAAWDDGWGWTTTSAHNLWLQAWLTTGALGLALVLAAQLAWLWQALRRPLPLRDAVVVLVLVVGVLEAGALGPSVNLMSFVWMWAMALGLRAHHD